MATIPANPTDVKEPLLAFDETTGIIDQYQIFDGTVAMVDARCPYLRSHPIDFATTKFSYAVGEQQHRINVLHVQKPFPVYSGNSYLRNLYRSTGGHLVYTSDYQAGNKFKNYYNPETDAFDGEEVNILRPVYCVDKLRHFLKTVEDSTTISEEYKDTLIFAPVLCGRNNYGGNSNFCGAYGTNNIYDEQWIQFVGKSGTSNPDSYAWSGSWRNQGTAGYFVLDGGPNYFGTSWLNTAIQVINNFSIPSASGVGTTDFSTYTLNTFRKNNQIMYGVVGPSNLNQVNGQLTKQVICEYEIETDAPIVWGIENAIRIASAEEWDDEFLAYILNYGTGGDTPTEDRPKRWYFWTLAGQYNTNNEQVEDNEYYAFDFVSDGNPIFYVSESTEGSVYNASLRIRKNSTIEDVNYLDHTSLSASEIIKFTAHDRSILTEGSYTDVKGRRPVVFPKPDGNPQYRNKGKGHYTSGSIWVQNVQYYTNIPVSSDLQTVEDYLNATSDDERKEILDNSGDDYNNDKPGKTSEDDLPDIDGKVSSTELPDSYRNTNAGGILYAMKWDELNSLIFEILNVANETVLERVVTGCKLLGANPMNVIRSLKCYPFDVTDYVSTDDLTVFNMGGVDLIDSFADFRTATGGSVKRVRNKIFRFQCGELFVPITDLTWKNYEPYSELYIYLPFVGVYKLDVATYFNSIIRVVYQIDLVTGACTALIIKNNILMASYDGVCGVDIALTGTDASRYAQMMIGNSLSVLKGAVGIAQSVVVGNAEAGLQAASGDVEEAMISKKNNGFNIAGQAIDLIGKGANLVTNLNTMVIQQRGTTQGAIGMLMPLKPFLYYTMQQTIEPENLQAEFGYPSNTGKKVSAFRGFLKAKSVKMPDGIESVTAQEQQQIVNMLKNGVQLGTGKVK